MSSTGTGRTVARRRAHRAPRAVLVLAVLLTALALGPGEAAATTTYYATGKVNPVLECVSRGSDGSWTAVLGYTNSAGTTTIPHGSWNSITPTRYDGTQPTLFKAGTVHGAWALKITSSDYTYGGTAWMLDGNMVFIGAVYDASTPTCTGVQLPAQGNDTGAGIALLVAGVVGALVLVRVRRRTSARSHGQEHVDA